jgi:hypothetical protein
MAQADYCHDPIEYLMLWIKPSGSTTINQYVSYYLTCTGPSPFYDTIYGVQYLLKEFDFYLSYLYASDGSGDDCLDANSYASLQSNIGILTDNVFPSLFTILSCEDYSDQWSTLVHDDVCGNMVRGLFSIWIVQLVVNSFMICILIYSSYLYPYLKQVADHQMSTEGGESLCDESQQRARTNSLSAAVSPLSLQVSKTNHIEMI